MQERQNAGNCWRLMQKRIVPMQTMDQMPDPAADGSSHEMVSSRLMTCGVELLT
jgi:hypothetical protein